MTIEKTEVTDPFVGLADYLTDPVRVMRASIGLEIGGKQAEDANGFFALRNSFNITGHRSVGYAHDAILAAYDDFLIAKLSNGA